MLRELNWMTECMGYHLMVFLLIVIKYLILPSIVFGQDGQLKPKNVRDQLNQEIQKQIVDADSSRDSSKVKLKSLQLKKFRSPIVIRTDNFSMKLGARLQIRYTYSDWEQSSQNSTFAIRQSRLFLNGNAYDFFQYDIHLEMGGASIKLSDANVRYQMSAMAIFLVGQHRAFFGRQKLTSRGSLNFVDRSIVDDRFSAGGQAGIAFFGLNDSHTFEYNLGIYNGTGMNTANDNGKYMKTARVVFTPFGAYPPVESAHDYPKSPRLALGVSGLQTTTGIEVNQTDILRLNLEGALKLNGWNISGEYYREIADYSDSSSVKTTGWYAQGGYLFPNLKNEVVLRFAAIHPESTTNLDMIETGIAFNYYLHAHGAKIQADVRNVGRKVVDIDNIEFRIQLQISL